MGNKIQDAFGNIKADPGLKESTKGFLEDKRRKKGGLFLPRAFCGTLAAVCAILLLAVGIGEYCWVQIPVSYVSIDINPSMELGLNRFERVVSATAYNPEGEEILQGLSLKGKKYTEAIDAVVTSRGMERYLTGEAELVLTIATDSSREEEIETGAAHCLDYVGNRCRKVSADMETAETAHHNGMSVGKYYAYLQLSQYDSTVTLDECRHMNMEQIHGLLRGHAQDSCQDAGQGNSDEASDDCQETEGESPDGSCADDEAGLGGHHSGEHHE